MPPAAEGFDGAFLGRTAGGRPSEVVTDDQQPAWPNNAGALREKALRVWPVHERFDREGEVGSWAVFREIAVIGLDAPNAVGQPRLGNALLRKLRLDRAQRDPGASNSEALCQRTQAGSNSAPQVDHMGADRPASIGVEPAQQFLNLTLDVAKGLLSVAGSRAPERPMDGAKVAALSEGDEFGRCGGRSSFEPAQCRTEASEYRWIESGIDIAGATLRVLGLERFQQLDRVYPAISHQPIRLAGRPVVTIAPKLG